MEINYAALIEQERKKIALLRTKIAECEKRITVLESMKGDDLDALLAKSLGIDESPLVAVTMGPSEPAQPEMNSGYTPEPEKEGPKKKIAAPTLELLAFVGKEGKSLDELEQFCARAGLPYNTRGSLRSFGNTYKNKYGLLASPKDGFFRLTERGMQFVGAHKGETPSVGAEGVSGTAT